MGWKEDEENAYRTKKGWFGRSIRRGTRKALKALTLGAAKGEPVSGSMKSLGADAAKDAAKAFKRSQED